MAENFGSGSRSLPDRRSQDTRGQLLLSQEISTVEKPDSMDRWVGGFGFPATRAAESVRKTRKFPSLTDNRPGHVRPINQNAKWCLCKCNEINMREIAK